MTERLKRLLGAGKGKASAPSRQSSEDAAAPPSAARKFRREANESMRLSLPFRNKDYSGMVSLSVPRSVLCWPESEECDGKRVPRPFALFSPANVPYGKGITACSQEDLRTLTCLFPS